MNAIVDEDHAPGRKRMRRASGRVDVYWVASPEAVQAGYVPKTIRLLDDPGGQHAPPEVAEQCRRAWAEMLEFVAGRTSPTLAFPVGSIGWMADLYTSDDEGPYAPIRPVTQEGYDKSVKIIKATVGARRIDSVTSKDVRRWYRMWGRAKGKDGPLKNPRRAYGCIQLLRIIMKYGKGLKNAACRELSEILSETEFPASGRRKQAMTAEHVAAFVPAAHDAGRPSMARAVVLQFACALRQKDVIGEWSKDVAGQMRWDIGLRWGEHIKADWTLKKPTSKSNFKETAEFNLALILMVMRELEIVPVTHRIGPVIIDERTGKPYAQRMFARCFRDIARTAGIPDEVWNMDARAGAISDAYDKGAKSEDAMDLGTHRQLSTNLGYKRGRIEATSRVTRLRFGKDGGDA